MPALIKDAFCCDCITTPPPTTPLPTTPLPTTIVPGTTLFPPTTIVPGTTLFPPTTPLPTTPLPTTPLPTTIVPATTITPTTPCVYQNRCPLQSAPVPLPCFIYIDGLPWSLTEGGCSYKPCYGGSSNELASVGGIFWALSYQGFQYSLSPQTSVPTGTYKIQGTHSKPDILVTADAPYEYVCACPTPCPTTVNPPATTPLPTTPLPTTPLPTTASPTTPLPTTPLPTTPLPTTPLPTTLAPTTPCPVPFNLCDYSSCTEVLPCTLKDNLNRDWVLVPSTVYIKCMYKLCDSPYLNTPEKDTKSNIRLYSSGGVVGRGVVGRGVVAGGFTVVGHGVGHAQTYS